MPPLLAVLVHSFPSSPCDSLKYMLGHTSLLTKSKLLLRIKSQFQFIVYDTPCNRISPHLNCSCANVSPLIAPQPLQASFLLLREQSSFSSPGLCTHSFLCNLADPFRVQLEYHLHCDVPSPFPCLQLLLSYVPVSLGHITLSCFFLAPHPAVA